MIPPAELVYILNQYNGCFENLFLFIEHYQYEKAKRQLLERYLGNGITAIGRCEMTYDEVLKMLDDEYYKVEKRTAKDIKQSILEKFGRK